MENIENPKETVIKHIVISGGGITGFTAYGILKESAKEGFWDINNIKTMYATSIGGLLMVILSLKFDWDTLDEYIIKRPWSNIFNLNIYSLINSFQTKGLFNIKIVESVFEPLFKAKDIKMDITMKEYFELSGIEIHLYATDFIETKTVDISYKTHPNWTVIESIYCSCCLPIMFTPYKKEDKIYYDGGVFSNYPLNYCCKNIDDTLSPSSTSEFSVSTPSHLQYDEILGVKTCTTDNKIEICEESTLFDYIIMIIKSFIYKLTIDDIIPIKNEIVIYSNFTSIYNDMYLAFSTIDNRKELINKGITLWKEFVGKAESKTESKTESHTEPNCETIESKTKEFVGEAETQTKFVGEVESKTEPIR